VETDHPGRLRPDRAREQHK